MHTALIIPAEVHSDDFLYTAAFDAEPWFRDAADEAVVDLAGCDWGGDYPADAVARGTPHDKVAAVLDYCQRVTIAGGTMGFECNVDPYAAMRWLKANRADLYTKIAADGRWE